MASNPISNVFDDPEKYDIDELLHGALYEKDPQKKKVYLALYNYVLGERQKKTINQKGFVR
ncbi:MAG: hypothetical protein LKH74_03175 [Levilactobacillus sp.]|jgi:hypothetical protein|uniref:Uncharacterized protein n=1 Tax=Levilactobacillus suantsaiihabitans TaxID=2487722 RepID=A0A4Z0JBD4_9LACO|nr:MULTISPECIES: hypothetical protein [Levilactobacillus]MCI1552903.1 hypothetical protein [Levilactobacillus sp.]MCI1598043.1 hypothetical protein [Levilactobacillus sp.]MCI1605677.1 hypothetical protein [Levilactobacillus sp.]TGD20030.1 hypothetical protein EGT51_02235 [Levilactobacillus suantsaiihabitans]